MKEPRRRTIEQAAAAPAHLDELTLCIAERAGRIALKRVLPPGSELALWLEAEAEVKRESHP